MEVWPWDKRFLLQLLPDKSFSIYLLKEGNNMCVGLSAKVVKVDEGTALIDTNGVHREVSAELLENLEPGDYVMVHAGIAIAKIEPKAPPLPHD